VKLHHLAVVAVLTCAACGSGSSVALSESCEAVADDAVQGANAVIERTGDPTIQELLASETPDFPSEVAQELGGIDARANAAGCSEDAFSVLLRRRAERIEGDGFFAELLRDAFERGDLSTLGGLGPSATEVAS